MTKMAVTVTAVNTHAAAARAVVVGRGEAVVAGEPAWRAMSP
jgi:hypothetical protein